MAVQTEKGKWADQRHLENSKTWWLGGGRGMGAKSWFRLLLGIRTSKWDKREKKIEKGLKDILNWLKFGISNTRDHMGQISAENFALRKGIDIELVT